MLFRTKLLATAATLALSASFAQADAHDGLTAETVVASVNGSDITLGQMIMLRAQLPDQYKQLPDETVFNGLVEQLVNLQLLADSLAVEPKRVGIAIANETRSLRAGEVIAAITSQPISEDDLQAAYDARFSEVDPDSEFNASHILLATEEEAIEVKALIDDGGDFAEIAMERSTGPSGPNGGSLGWFGLGMMVPEFEEAVLTLEPGDVSDPVQTQFGWHIVTLIEMRETPLPTLEDLRPELTTEIQQDNLNAQVELLTQGSEITLPEDGQFDFSVIQNLDLLQD